MGGCERGEVEEGEEEAERKMHGEEKWRMGTRVIYTKWDQAAKREGRGNRGGRALWHLNIEQKRRQRKVLYTLYSRHLQGPSPFKQTIYCSHVPPTLPSTPLMHNTTELSTLRSLLLQNNSQGHLVSMPRRKARPRQRHISNLPKQAQYPSIYLRQGFKPARE